MKEVLPDADVIVHAPAVDRVNVAMRAKKFVKKIIKKSLTF